MTIPCGITSIGIGNGIAIPIRVSHQSRLSIRSKTLILYKHSIPTTLKVR